MKYILQIIIFLLITININGQNVISLTFAGSDFAFGGRYDHQFGRYGLYAGSGFGHYVNGECGTVSHLKASAGIMKYIQNNQMDEWITYFSLGANGHYYKTIIKGTEELEGHAIFPVSFEIGTGFIVEKRFMCGWTWDVIKREVVINVGYRFGR